MPDAPDFDTLCDPSAPGTLVPPKELWAAVIAAALASKEGMKDVTKEDDDER